MIVSMTGYGTAQQTHDDVSYAAEVRSVNGRYLKLSIKLPEHLQFAESEVDKLLRKRLARGTVTFALRIRTEGANATRSLNMAALQGYVDQLTKIKLPDSVRPMIGLATLATLPGVAEQLEPDDDARARTLEAIINVAGDAVGALLDMRRDEGRSLAEDLSACTDRIREELAAVQDRAPSVIHEYHDRLKARVATLTQTAQLELDSEALMREVAIYADRCDIAEEVSRMGSHLDQFADLCGRGEKVGRTLDFLAQELLREANTIGSKSNDTAVARSVVEIKGLIDRLKEQVQNVE